MGNENSMIQTSSIPLKQLSNATNQLAGAISIQSFRRFGQKIKTSSQQHHHQKITLRVQEPFSELINIQTTVYQELEDACNYKTEQIVIESIIRDKDVSQRLIFQGRNKDDQISLIIRPFGSEQSYLFDNILYQVYFASLCSSFNNSNLHKMIDNYVINTPLEIEDPNSHVLVMQRVNMSLSQIISFKRQNKWDWQINQFKRFAFDIINAVSTLHANNIAHNDIRPSNIYFSLARNQYQLSSYSNCVKIGKKKIEDLDDKHLQAEPLKKDVYALGKTLLSAYYLCENINIQLINKLNQKQMLQHQIFGLILKMLLPSKQRPNIIGIKSALQILPYDYKSMTNMIQLIQHRKTESYDQKIGQKRSISQAYQKLGLWVQWKRQYKQVFDLQYNDSNDLHKADGYYQLALIQHCMGQDENSQSNAKQANDLYRLLGKAEKEIGATSKAQIYYKKALSCAKYYEQPNHLDVAKTLHGLSDLHAHKRQYNRAKVLANEATNIIIKTPNGRDSFEWCQSRIKQAKIQTDSGAYLNAINNTTQANKAYENALKILDQCQKFTQKKAGLNSQWSDSLKAQAKAQRGRSQLLRSEHGGKDETTYLNWAEENLLQALKIQKSIQNRHQQIAQIIKMLGQINFKKTQYQLAIKDFNKSIGFLNELEINKQKQTKEKADVLCLRALALSHHKDFQNACKDIESALAIYRNFYGSDHNRSSALAIGILGKIYENDKKDAKARQCQNISRQLLGQLGYDGERLKNELLLEQSLNISQIVHQ